MNTEPVKPINAGIPSPAAHPPKVSIGMPVYNGEPFIREALDSLLAQTFTDFELIISDNASTDGTEAICREYAARDARIRYVRQAENRGVGANFKFVLEEAVGGYFMWTAVDDRLSADDYLQQLLRNLGPGVDYAFPDISITDSRGKVLQAGVMSPFKGLLTRFQFSKASLKLNSYQVYGLFVTLRLREDFRFIEQCRQMLCFNEGLFVHAISAERIGVFVPAACKLYCRHEANASSVLPAKILLPEFLKYSKASIMYYILSTRFTLVEKLSLVLLKSYIDSRYSLYLLLAVIAHMLPALKAWKRNLSL